MASSRVKKKTRCANGVILRIDTEVETEIEDEFFLLPFYEGKINIDRMIGFDSPSDFFKEMEFNELFFVEFKTKEIKEGRKFRLEYVASVPLLVGTFTDILHNSEELFTSTINEIIHLSHEEDIFSIKDSSVL